MDAASEEGCWRKGILNAKFVNQQISITESLVLRKHERNKEIYRDTLQWSLDFPMSVDSVAQCSLTRLTLCSVQTLQISSLCTTLNNVYKVFRTLPVVLLRSLSS